MVLFVGCIGIVYALLQPHPVAPCSTQATLTIANSEHRFTGYPAELQKALFITDDDDVEEDNAYVVADVTHRLQQQVGSGARRGVSQRAQLITATRQHHTRSQQATPPSPPSPTQSTSTALLPPSLAPAEIMAKTARPTQPWRRGGARIGCGVRQPTNKMLLWVCMLCVYLLPPCLSCRSPRVPSTTGCVRQRRRPAGRGARGRRSCWTCRCSCSRGPTVRWDAYGCLCACGCCVLLLFADIAVSRLTAHSVLAHSPTSRCGHPLPLSRLLVNTMCCAHTQVGEE